MQMIDEATATKLANLLRGELSAVEAYSQAIEKLREPRLVSILQEAHNCHAMRANKLHTKLEELGQEVELSSGAWGAFTRLIESGAQLLGDAATIAVLEEGEDHGLSQYKSLFGDTDPTLKQMVREFLPLQEGTHRIMHDLKVSLA